MMSLRVLLLAAGAAAGLAGGLDASGSCATSPLLSALSCTEMRPAAPQLEANNTTLLDPDAVWEGPHSCAGVFCVYSNWAFAAGKGVVVISTARSAEAIAKLPAFRSVATRFTSHDDLFRLTEVPGKGLGLVAQRPIRRGLPIMARSPTVIAHRRIVDELSQDEQERLLEAAVARLPGATRTTFLAQMGHFGGHRIRDIIFTNSFELGLPVEDGHHFANFPEASRFNHDCRPNVAFYMDADLTHRTHVVRDIAAGEELTISYVNAFRVRAVRQARAERSWGFGCTCAHCSLPAPLANASDNRLFRIYEIETELADWKSKIDADAIELLMSLYAQERLLESHAADAYTLAALNYNALGREVLAVKYALLSLEQGVLENGPAAPDVAAMVSLLEAPRSHWSWRKRG
ncbi:SET domain-containing protein [Thozetella sp. PMI_491]|nr:SET domain-containing protein [Thozetella sp. PMI_491]